MPRVVCEGCGAEVPFNQGEEPPALCADCLRATLSDPAEPNRVTCESCGRVFLIAREDSSGLTLCSICLAELHSTSARRRLVLGVGAVVGLGVIAIALGFALRRTSHQQGLSADAGTAAMNGAAALLSDDAGAPPDYPKLGNGPLEKVIKVLREPTSRGTFGYYYMDVLCEPMAEDDAKTLGLALFEAAVPKAPHDTGLMARVFYAEDAWCGAGTSDFSAVTVWAERKGATAATSVRVHGFLPACTEPQKVYQVFRERATLLRWPADGFDDRSAWISLGTRGYTGGVNTYPEAVFYLLSVFNCDSPHEEAFSMMPAVKGIKLRLINSVGECVAEVHGDRRAHERLQNEYDRRYDARAELSERESELWQRHMAGALTTNEYKEQLRGIAQEKHEWAEAVWVAASPHFRHKWFSDDLSREVPDNLY